ncbi:MAG: LptF/LptG family permease, partial [Lentisphaeria bacterium]|nr:LptF/LptG family permease [Lentisphaeria bacterium]
MKEVEKNYRSMIVIARRWLWMPTLDWYVLREFLLKLGILLFVFATLFILGDVLNELEDFLSREASIRDFITFLMLKLPGNMRFVMPLSLLLGCIWTMAAFGKNSEIVAMRSSGISLYRCAASILLIGFGTTVLNIYFNEALVPFTEREA